jgi:acyl-CoA reductase-like NAD-dependent aldehyde dehydrogenase
MLVHASLHDAFVEKLRVKVNALKMGDPLDEATDIGTIISQSQFDKVRRYIELGSSVEGAKAHALSSMPTDPRLARGLFIQPVVFTGIPNDHRLATEEIFGPVTCVIPFDTLDEALEMANASEFGLAATVWTTNLKSAMTAAQRLQAGLVQVNQNLVARAGISYGGVKHSGLGKEASLEAMLEHFTTKKTVLINMA